MEMFFFFLQFLTVVSVSGVTIGGEAIHSAKWKMTISSLQSTFSQETILTSCIYKLRCIRQSLDKQPFGS